MRYLAILLIGASAQFAIAQEDVLASLRRSSRETLQKYPMSRPLLFFSQDQYAPGDTAWFRLFMLTESASRIPQRILLNVELTDGNGKLLVRQYVPCSAFGVANQIILPENLAPGVYRLRVYSKEWDSNFGVKHNLMITDEHHLERVPPENKRLEIYPEGGSLVPGTVNRVVVKSNYKPSTELTLRSKENMITTVKINDAGLGQAEFVPGQGSDYTITDPQYPNVTSGLTIPTEAITLRLNPGPTGGHIVNVMGTSSYIGRKLYFVVLSLREVVHGQEVSLGPDGSAYVVLAPGMVPEGYSQLTLLDDQGKVLAVRPSYRKPRRVIEIHADGLPNQTMQREKLKLTIRMTNEREQPLEGAFAVSVFSSSAALIPSTTPDPSVILYPEPVDVNLAAAEDDINIQLMAKPSRLMLPLGPVENVGYRTNFTLQGKATYDNGKNKLPDSSSLIVYFHNDRIWYETLIRQDGSFLFPRIYDFIGSDLVYYKAVKKMRDLPPVQIQWDVDPQVIEEEIKTDVYKSIQPADEYGSMRKLKKMIDRSYTFFNSPPPDHRKVPNPNEIFEDEFQEADIVINPKEYLPFETMEELVREVIPALVFRKKPDSSLRVMLTTHSHFSKQRYATGNPLIIIDGFLTPSLSYFMQFRPSEITFVKVINEIGKLDRLGSLGYNGVVFVQTLTPEKTAKKLKEGLLQVEGLSPTLSFPKSLPSDPRIPDLRSTLYWNPILKTDSTASASFEFRTSDIPGPYIVRIMGLTSDGHLVSSEKSFSVNFKK